MKTPRHTDEQIAAAVQAFIAAYEFEKDDPPSRKVLESFAEDSGFDYKRIRYQFKLMGYDVTPYLDGASVSPKGLSAGVASVRAPLVAEQPKTPADQAAEYVKAHFERLSKFVVYDEWLPDMNKTGIKYHVLSTAFDIEKRAR